MMNRMNPSAYATLVAAIALVAGWLPATAPAATLNISSLETVLANPMDMTSKMYALWTGWQTQVFEYNMPFIELANGANDVSTINSFRFSIGDTRYHFSNQFLNKAKTNSYVIPANGQYALEGVTTPGIPFTTSLEDNGDTLVVNFTNGLKPGQTVRLQVDIDPDAGATGVQTFAPYSSVFFTPNGGSNTANNSRITLDYAGTTPDSTLTLPNFAVGSNNLVSLSTPRPYNQMQTIEVFPDVIISDPIPEPASATMAAVAVWSVARRRRSRAA